MKILINASNLRVGGGVQVADSVCRELYRFPQHQFVVVLPRCLEACAQIVEQYDNVKVVRYELPVKLWTVLTGCCRKLDVLVRNEEVDVVLTVFGPSRWIPKCLHISGFARPQLVLADSPFWKIIPFLMRLKYKFRRPVMTALFKRSADVFFTESAFISMRLHKLFKDKRIYTVTNNYNQVFDRQAEWDKSIELPAFDGLTLLTISANYPHKHLSIIRTIINQLLTKYPQLRFRFVLTLTEEQFGSLTDEERQHIVFLGRVSIAKCPSLYEQADVMFLPTLLECFSASYAEAMRMGVPILTTDLEFAHSLCADAALYYNALSAEDAADKVAKLSSDKQLRQKLIDNGKRQLQRFDTFEQRAAKLIEIVEQEYKRTTK